MNNTHVNNVQRTPHVKATLPWRMAYLIFVQATSLPFFDFASQKRIVLMSGVLIFSAVFLCRTDRRNTYLPVLPDVAQGQ